ncbi:MAG: AgmX/PglI C-terminal domain-containing protein, partial [Desulfatitalea sp.]|nr:AgmX/PglI C-terminal domain-containing protein [Desulfatitalea sp.]
MEHITGQVNRSNSRFCVYEHQVYIGESVFDKTRISIGKSREADIILNNGNIADIHALVQFEQGQAVLFNKNIGNGLRLNGLSIKESLLRAEDVIQLGPYAIVFKPEAETTTRPVLPAPPETPLELVVDNGSDGLDTPPPMAPEDDAEAQEEELCLAPDTHIAHKRIQALTADPQAQADVQKSSPADNDPSETAAVATSVDAAATGESIVHRDPAPLWDDMDRPGSTYSVVLVNDYPSEASKQGAIERFAALFRCEPDKVAKLFKKPRYILKKDMQEYIALRMKGALEKAGVLCTMAVGDAPVPGLDPRASFGLPAAAEADESHFVGEGSAPGAESEANDDCAASDETSPVPAAEAEAMGAHLPAMGVALYADEEEDEEDPWDAPFSLKEKLIASPGSACSTRKPAPQARVIKSLGDRVIDTSFVAGGRKLTIRSTQGKFPLVVSSAKETIDVHIWPGLHGFVEGKAGARTDLQAYRRENNLISKRKQLYRFEVPQQGQVVVFDDAYRYDIALTDEPSSPDMPVPPAEKTLTWRHWGTSAAIHLLVVLVLSIYAYVQGNTLAEKEPHFVKIDAASLKAMEARKQIKPPKKEPPPPKPEPVKVAKKKAPTTKAQATRRAKTSSKKVARAARPSRHPKAGGGFGKGNIKNRNINQTGLLSILGKNAVPGPSEAIASVTNIDAVKVPGATEKNFTVGGIKGSLGTNKISMGTGGTGGIVTTKGSKQVLRSAGASGPGQVAALEKGTTGQKQVKGSVTAKMSRSVKIEGGMSREMVKRVIDQHLGEITYCYESALTANPTISGRVIFEWKILMNGRVGQIRIVASSINS